MVTTITTCPKPKNLIFCNAVLCVNDGYIIYNIYVIYNIYSYYLLSTGSFLEKFLVFQIGSISSVVAVYTSIYSHIA